jgi:hypothetical protein
MNERYGYLLLLFKGSMTRFLRRGKQSRNNVFSPGDLLILAIAYTDDLRIASPDADSPIGSQARVWACGRPRCLQSYSGAEPLFQYLFSPS